MPFYYYWGGLLQKKMIEELLVYDCNLNIKSFIQMLDDPTECYKFYWLDSIIQLLIRGDESITFDKVIYGMIADAWFSVSKCNLKLGPRNINGESANSIERAVRKLEKLNIIADIDTRDEIIFKIKKHKKELHDEIYVNCNIKMYKKWKIKMYILFHNLVSFWCFQKGSLVLQTI